MKNILAIDTSTSKQLILALYCGEDSLYENKTVLHLESELLPTIDTALKKFSLSTHDIDTYILGAGAGSFMGLRLGFSVLRTWAWIHNTPIITVSSQELLVRSFLYHNGTTNGLIIPVVDGKMKRVFTAIFHNTERISIDQDISPKECAEQILEKNIFPIYLVGNGAHLVQEHLPSSSEIYTFLDQGIIPEAFSLDWINSIPKNNFSQRSKDMLVSIEPQYLRLSAAEEQYIKKNPPK